MSKFLFWFDDAYGQERMFTFEGTETEAIRRAEELCGDGVECLTVESYETEQVVFDQRNYELTVAGFEIEQTWLVTWEDEDGRERIREFIGTASQAEDEEIRLHELGFRDAFVEPYEG